MQMKDEYFFLSNFYPCEIKTTYGTFPSVENAYQSMKDVNKANLFFNITPGKAKRLGSNPNIIHLRADWEEIKLQLMEDLIRQKFQKEEMKNQLIKVTEPITEDNNWGDSYWGVYNGKGENHLGKILTKIRNEILEENKNENR